MDKKSRIKRSARSKRLGGKAAVTVSKRAGAEIAYQNKDIASKFFTGQLKGKSFQVYGINVPEVKGLLPTNLPVIKVNELRIDNLLELGDGSVAVVDYESEYKNESKAKYINYLAGVVNRYMTEKKSCPILRMIVIYTGDIRREEVSDSFDAGAMRIVIEPAFLSEIDGEGIYRSLSEKVEAGEDLSDEEQMRFIVLPLTYRKKEEKERKIRETVELASKIRNREQQVFVLAGILTFTDKIIDEKTAIKIRRLIQMTKVGMIIAKEQEEAVKAARDEERRKAWKTIKEEKQKNQEEKRDSVLKMLQDGLIPLQKIAEYSGMDIQAVTELARSVL